LASKDALIKEFQNQLKKKDEEYVMALKVETEDIETLVDRMSQQYREMQEEYDLELEQIEDAFLKVRIKKKSMIYAFVMRVTTTS
jgi:dynein regulatory complex protein 1